jgi:hypothetical protein
VVQQHIVHAFDRMGLDVAAPSMLRRQVKEHLIALERLLGEVRIPQVALDEGDRIPDIGQMRERAAGKIVHHGNGSAILNQQFDQVGADEGGSSGHDYFSATIEIGQAGHGRGAGCRG